MDSATVFKGLSSIIQNDIISSISSFLLSEIENELDECMYVAILLDETSDVSCFSQLSTVVRYVTSSGDICERFIRFTDMTRDRSAAGISELVIKHLTELACIKKLIAQTYDGAAVMAGIVNGFQAQFKESVPEAIFIHCYTHKLNLVLFQDSNHISKCNIFFSTIGGISSFFSSSSKRTNIIVR